MIPTINEINYMEIIPRVNNNTTLTAKKLSTRKCFPI